RQLAKVINSQGPDAPADIGHGPQRNQSSRSRTNVKIGQRRGVSLIFRHEFHNYPVLIYRRIDSRDLPLPVSIVERVFDLIRSYAQGVSFVAIDVDDYLRAADE